MNPKERFLKTPAAKVFADVAVSESFQLALEYALLEMQGQMSKDDDPTKGWAASCRMNGAMQFAKILSQLPYPTEPEKPFKSPTLNHDAYNRPARASNIATKA